MTTIRQETLILSGAQVGDENPLPYPRDCAFDKPLVDAGLTPAERTGFRFMTGSRWLPYRMQDGYHRDKAPISLQTVVLENQALRARFLPEYGGRLYSLYDKEREKELLFVNPVFQPCNLAVRNAWFSGGIEWNVGQYGHTSLTCAPVFFGVCEGKQGPFLRMYEYERIKGLYLQIDFHLPEGERHLFAHVRICNRHEDPVSLYWWTNTAVELNRRVRVLSGTADVVATMPSDGRYTAFTHDSLPVLSYIPEADASYPQDCPFSVEYFFQNPPEIDKTWEAAVYNDGTAFYERSTPEMPYRKMFCWGNQTGGRRWQEFLSTPEAPEYLEVQSGLFPTQVHGGEMGPGQSVAFTQAFGGCDTDSTITHAESWSDACGYFHSLLEEHLSVAHLNKLDKAFRVMARTHPQRLLYQGSGWGALEEKRRPGITPEGLLFPKETLGPEQAPWLSLLETGELPPWTGIAPPSYQCDPRWLRLLEDAVKQQATAANLFHLGLARFECGDPAGGACCMEQAAGLDGAPVILRTLAMMQKRMGALDAAVQSMHAAMTGEALHSRFFAQDYLELLIETGRYEDAWKCYCSLDEAVQKAERITLLAAEAAYELGEDDFLRAQFEREFATIREGETRLFELWFKDRARTLSRETGMGFDEALLKVRQTQPLPYLLNFKMYEV